MKDRKWLRVVLICTGILAVFYFSAALVLVTAPDPTFSATAVFSVSTAEAEGIVEMLKQDHEYGERRFVARDGVELFARHYAAGGGPTVLLLHGIASSSYTSNTTCGMIREAAGAEVYALDFRGHGDSSGERGDVDYIGQYEDDVADVIAAIRGEKPGGKLILAGHSMGGGIALRYAMKKGTSDVDGYLLFAPHLGFDSPTASLYRPQTDRATGEPPFKIHLARLVGLFMLNFLGIGGFNDSQVVFYNHPTDSPQAPVGRYTYRALSNTAPTNHKAALAAVDRPLLVLVGSNDEPFVPEQFKPVVEENSDGKVMLFEGLGHESIMFDPDAIAAAGKWISAL